MNFLLFPNLFFEPDFTAWTTAKTSVEKLKTSTLAPTTTSSQTDATSTAVSWPESKLTESTSPKSTETLKTSTFKVFEKDNRCGISHALSISSGSCLYRQTLESFSIRVRSILASLIFC